MTQNKQINTEAAKALIGYYSWHMDELLGFCNAAGGTNETDVSKVHLEIGDGYVYFGINGFHTYFMKL